MPNKGKATRSSATTTSHPSRRGSFERKRPVSTATGVDPHSSLLTFSGDRPVEEFDENRLPSRGHVSTAAWLYANTVTSTLPDEVDTHRPRSLSRHRGLEDRGESNGVTVRRYRVDSAASSRDQSRVRPYMPPSTTDEPGLVFAPPRPRASTFPIASERRSEHGSSRSSSCSSFSRSRSSRSPSRSRSQSRSRSRSGSRSREGDAVDRHRSRGRKNSYVSLKELLSDAGKVLQAGSPRSRMDEDSPARGRPRREEVQHRVSTLDARSLSAEFSRVPSSAHQSRPGSAGSQDPARRDRSMSRGSAHTSVSRSLSRDSEYSHSSRSSGDDRPTTSRRYTDLRSYQTQENRGRGRRDSIDSADSRSSSRSILKGPGTNFAKRVLSENSSRPRVSFDLGTRPETTEFDEDAPPLEVSSARARGTSTAAARTTERRSRADSASSAASGGSLRAMLAKKAQKATGNFFSHDPHPNDIAFGVKPKVKGKAPSTHDHASGSSRRK